MRYVSIELMTSYIYILRLHRGRYDREGAFHDQAFIVRISAAVEHSQLFLIYLFIISCNSAVLATHVVSGGVLKCLCYT
jgi:hypothetical protein